MGDDDLDQLRAAWMLVPQTQDPFTRSMRFCVVLAPPTDEALERLREHARQRPGERLPFLHDWPPFPPDVLSAELHLDDLLCPWCGTDLGVRDSNVTPRERLLECPNRRCGSLASGGQGERWTGRVISKRWPPRRRDSQELGWRAS